MFTYADISLPHSCPLKLCDGLLEFLCTQTASSYPKVIVLLFFIKTGIILRLVQGNKSNCWFEWCLEATGKASEIDQDHRNFFVGKLPDTGDLLNRTEIGCKTTKLKKNPTHASHLYGWWWQAKVAMDHPWNCRLSMDAATWTPLWRKLDLVTPTLVIL